MFRYAEQRREIGFARRTIAGRTRAGRLHRLHQGIYAVGQPSLSDRGRWIAAVLADGAGAILSHASAAALWGFLEPRPGPVDISLPSRAGRRRRDGIRIHRTRNDLERDFVAFVRRHRLPPPEVNFRVDAGRGRWFTVDFLWPAARLAVETDSYRHHRGDVSFEDDHARDLALRRCGFTVLRYTGRQLDREGAAIAAELRERLAAPPP